MCHTKLFVLHICPPNHTLIIRSGLLICQYLMKLTLYKVHHRKRTPKIFKTFFVEKMQTPAPLCQCKKIWKVLGVTVLFQFQSFKKISVFKIIILHLIANSIHSMDNSQQKLNTIQFHNKLKHRLYGDKIQYF